MSTEHTPGPWHANVSAKYPVFAGEAPNHVRIGHVYGYEAGDKARHGITREEAEANLLLFAAAPEMLAALKLQKEAQIRAQAASDATPDGQVITKAVHDDVAAWFVRAERAAAAAIAKAEGR